MEAVGGLLAHPAVMENAKRRDTVAAPIRTPSDRLLEIPGKKGIPGSFVSMVPVVDPKSEITGEYSTIGEKRQKKTGPGGAPVFVELTKNGKPDYMVIFMKWATRFFDQQDSLWSEQME